MCVRLGLTVGELDKKRPSDFRGDLFQSAAERECQFLGRNCCLYYLIGQEASGAWLELATKGNKECLSPRPEMVAIWGDLFDLLTPK